MFFGMADLEVLLTVRKALQSEVLHTEPSTQIPSRRGMTEHEKPSEKGGSLFGDI